MLAQAQSEEQNFLNICFCLILSRVIVSVGVSSVVLVISRKKHDWPVLEGDFRKAWVWKGNRVVFVV